MSTGVQTAVGQIVWHTLMTTDVEQATSFYGELLGWEYEVFKPGELDVPMIRQHGLEHGGIQPIQGEGTPPHWYGYVQVEDLAATTGRVESAGGRTLVPATPIPDVGSFAIFADGMTFADRVLGAQGPVEMTDVSDVNGLPALGLVFAETGGTLWVSAEGDPLPIQFDEKGASGGTGVLTFTDFGAEVAIQAPAAESVVDAESLPAP